MMNQIKAMMASQGQNLIHSPVTARGNTRPAKVSAPRKSPKAVLPLDHDERGFGDF